MYRLVAKSLRPKKVETAKNSQEVELVNRQATTAPATSVVVVACKTTSTITTTATKGTVMTPAQSIMTDAQRRPLVTPFFVEMRGRRLMVVEELTHGGRLGDVADWRDGYLRHPFANGHESGSAEIFCAHT